MSHSTTKKRSIVMAAVLATTMTLTCGCQSARYWWNNNKMVGPNYAAPNAPLAESFRPADAENPLAVDMSTQGIGNWWTVLNDPDLDMLIDQVKSQNLSLKAACFRIKEARHRRNIAAANLFPQSQTANGAFQHTQISRNAANALPFAPLTFDDWSTRFDAGWEIDFWGRIRRSIAANDAIVDSRIHDYNFALVSLIGDVASLYIQIRALDERIELAQKNVELQAGSLNIAVRRFEEGRTDKLDVVQAESNLATTKALIPQFELARRQSLNALAVLLGVPPSDIPSLSDTPGRIPNIPANLVVGIPADLILRRPDLRAAERNMAAQFEQIGITEADMYPTMSVGGTLGWQAARLSDLYQSSSFTGTIAPSFRWNILNYGRIEQAVCAEKALFEQIKLDYQNSVLAAQREVEDGIAAFIKSQEQLEFNLATEKANTEAVDLAVASFKEGKTDFGRVFVVQSNLVAAQDQVVATRTEIALALVATYKALGGGWQQTEFSQLPVAEGETIQIEAPGEFIQPADSLLN